MSTTVTALIVVVGLLIGALAAVTGRLAGVTRKLDDVDDRARVNASTIEMRTQSRDGDAPFRSLDDLELQRQ